MENSLNKATSARTQPPQSQLQPPPKSQPQTQTQTQTPTPTPTPPQPQHSLHATPRRPSSINVRETLPTPPPDPRESENVFKFPPTKQDLLSEYDTLFNYVENEEEFYKTLNKLIAQDCKQQQQQQQQQEQQSQHPPNAETPSKAASASDVGATDEAAAAADEHRCAFCQHLRYECKQFIDPLHSRLGSTLSALLVAQGAVDQLSRLYAMLDKYCESAQKWRQRKQRLHYVNLLHEKVRHVRDGSDKNLQHQYSDTEADVEPSIALIEPILAEAAMASAPAPGGGSGTASMKRSTPKHQRERSKSMMVDDVLSSGILGRAEHEREVKSSSTVPQVLRRQSTYSEGKSKVSKWTKVKAAFKWERANVPALSEGGQKDLSPNGIGLTPNNNEVARYLRVPSVPCSGGGSSADSILSSSSGHLLSETGTPGTISSASSMDDIDSSGRSTMRRGSTKSDTRYDTRTSDDAEFSNDFHKFDDSEQQQQQKSTKTDVNAKMMFPVKSASIKSLRRGKTLSDFEALPEDVVAKIKSTPTRKTKPPPSPLNLNLKQDLTDSDFSYSPYSLKSPKDVTQSLNRSKKISSPGNSSVPSSPSRHSDFFAEFESEDLSSGDFSEPTSPNLASSYKPFYDKQQEINKRYELLRAKLDKEFEAKRREWEKMRRNTNACRAISLITPPKSEEHTQNPTFSTNLSAKLLEENLTPDFKKKLRKWRVKKQISVAGSHVQQTSPTSPNRDSGGETKTKIDWNLWKTGQLKLEGQGLTPLPDQKDLPEEFQKKLEQWKKIKKGGSGSGVNFAASGHDSIKRLGKHADGGKKGAEYERSALDKDRRSDKHKSHEKDKLETLAKLKAIVADHPAKEIEVKTSEGVMKFEGISRKFTRKLYEWEKARGIGPESSTFALLHPGYRPIVVDRISKESHTTENSPTLSRSFSLDSITPNAALPGISQQASSLSLNDVNELKDIEGMTGADVISDGEFKKYEEPEAVMVEVEDHIEETASPLITAHTLVEQQTPIYKYEEVTCGDYCNTRRVQSFESHTNLAPLLSALQRTDEIFFKLKASPEFAENEEVRRCETALSFIRSIYPYYSDNLMKPNVLNAISDVQSELCRISDLCEKSPLDEACCQETMMERNTEYNEELKGLHQSLELLRQNIHGGSNRFRKEIVPDINITTVDMCTPSVDFSAEKEQLSPRMTVTDDLGAQHAANEDTETASITQRAHSSNNAANGGGKKKLRLRKMGSRQNSKTESDSSDEDAHSALETPRRLKRKNFRFKQRSFDDDYRKSEGATGDDVVYVLKVMPGHPIEQRENIGRVERSATKRHSLTRAGSEKCLSEPPTQVCPQRVQLLPTESVNQNANVFVKTKRKVFTTVEEPNTIDGIAVVEQDVEHVQSDSSGTCGALNTVEQPNASEPESQQNFTTFLQVRLKPNKPPYALCKSLSQNDLRANEFDCEEERRCHSAADLADSVPKRIKGVRTPLASDSFRVLNKSCTSLLKELSAVARNGCNERPDPASVSPVQYRKEHRFKKNTDKSSQHQIPFTKSQSGTVKKIETKIAKTNSGTSIVEPMPQQLTPDKMDNTLPRISRKLERNHPLSPSSNTQRMKFDFPTPNNSEPTTPFLATPTDTPRTPLSERAQRLLKAKEDFLRSTLARSQAEIKRRDDIVRNDTWEKYRCSDYSLSSTAGGDADLPKSLSVGTITADSFTETPTQSDAGTDQDIGLYDSLPRTVSRSGKISSKLGFATLASKFRRGKGGKKSKDSEFGNTAGKGSSSALSALCRQTLLADVIAGPQLAVEAGDSRRSAENVKKSQSSPHAGRGGEIGVAKDREVRRERERLNKSQSEQYVKCQKESLV